VPVRSDPEIQIALIDDETPSLPPAASGADLLPRRRPPSRYVLGGFAVAAAAIAAIAMLRSEAPGRPLVAPAIVTPRADAPPPRSPAPGPATPAVAPPPAAELAPTVHVHFETTPPGAQVRRGSRVLGTTPCELELERGTEPVEVSIDRAGYARAREWIVPSVDARLRIHLTRARVVEPRHTRERPVFYSFD